MKSEILEQNLLSREEFFKRKILDTIDTEFGHTLEPLEKSRLDIIHAYVKEITTIQRTRYEMENMGL